MNTKAIKSESGLGEIEVVRCQRTIGAEIRGVDLTKPVSDVVFRAIYDTLLRYKVIFFRDQHINVDQHMAFSKLFGELETNPFRPQGEDKPELQIIKNDKDHRVLSTDVWHSDLTFRKHPTKFTVLRCLEIPEYGGDTLWADMCAAYECLNPKLREFIFGLRAIHDFKNFRGLYKEDPKKREDLHRREDRM